MKKEIMDKLAELARKMAEKAFCEASHYGFHQPKEPENIKNTK